MNRTTVYCHCGHRITARDVLRKHYYRDAELGILQVRFRCSNCRRLGEKVVECSDWEEPVLEGDPNDFTPRERRRFQRLGPITAEEASAFHAELDRPDALSLLVGDGPPST